MLIQSLIEGRSEPNKSGERIGSLITFPVIIKRGTHQRNSTQEYKFKPNEYGDEICDVTEPKHIRRLIMEIPEGYRPYGEEAEAEAEKEYGWSEEVGIDKDDDRDQPAVIDEEAWPDDDNLGENLGGEDGDGSESDKDDDIPTQETEKGETREPQSKEEWLTWGAGLEGVTDVNDKMQLEAYAQGNYGEDLNRSLSVVNLLKAIWKLDNKDDG